MVEARKKYGPTFDHFFSLTRIVGLPVEHRFLSLAQALESYHRRAFPEMTREPIEAVQARRERLLTHATDDDREWLAAVTRHAHEPRLSDRLGAVYDLMPQTVQTRLGSRNSFSFRVTDTRNYMTHFDPAARQRAVTDPKKLWLLGEQLALVLRVLFVRELGLDADGLLASQWGQDILWVIDQNS